MTPEYGASTQLEKIEMLGSADFIVLNKFEKPRSEDALRDITRQVRRERGWQTQSLLTFQKMSCLFLPQLLLGLTIAE